MAGNPFFKAENFDRLTLSVQAANNTSRVRLPDGEVELTEMDGQTLQLEVPSRSCSIGHVLVLMIGATMPGRPEKELPVSGTVEELDEISEQRARVRLRLRQFPKREWEALLGYFTQREAALNELIERTRR